MIIKIHGTSGSGKTTIIRDLMALSEPPAAECMNMTTGKVEAHILHVPGVARPIVVLGPYGKSHCGGLDAVSGTDNHVILLRRYVGWGHVLYEGLLGSECYGAMGAASAEYAGDHVFAFLDTPIEECIARVKQRRLAAGNTKPLNEENTRGRVPKIDRLRRKLQGELGRTVKTIPYTHATEVVLQWLKEAP